MSNPTPYITHYFLRGILRVLVIAILFSFFATFILAPNNKEVYPSRQPIIKESIDENVRNSVRSLPEHPTSGAEQP